MSPTSDEKPRSGVLVAAATSRRSGTIGPVISTRGGSPAQPEAPMRPRAPSGTDTSEDARLFREAVRDVKPLMRPGPQVPRPRPPPRPTARFTRADRLAVLEESLREEVMDPTLAGGEELLFHRAGIQPAVLRKLRRGGYRVQAEIDLHGLTVGEAKQALREFLAQALLRQWRCVRIIHGKGLRSGHRGPVLKSMVGAMLRKLDPVLAYVSARHVDGGTGAVYVLLSS